VAYTYPLVVSLSGSDHNFLFEKIHDEIEINNTAPIQALYSVHSPLRKIPVTISAVASVHDQPEQRSILGLSGGNSLYHTRFGYSMDTSFTAPRLKACKSCYSAMIEEMQKWTFDYDDIGNFSKWGEHNCLLCVRWNYKVDSPLLSFPPPKNYPSNFNTLPNGHICAKKLSFQMLNEIVSDCQDNIISGKWLPKEAEAVLRSSNILS
jgi:hypothetical protein